MLRLLLTLFLGVCSPLSALSTGQTVVVDFDHFPGADGVLGTADDIPIIAPSAFLDQAAQLTHEFASLGVHFTPAPSTEDVNEILTVDGFQPPATVSLPNLLASRGVGEVVQGEFSVPVSRVSALVGLGSGEAELEIYDASGNSLGSGTGDAIFVSLSSTTPIARFVLRPVTFSFAAMDNLEFDLAPSIGQTFCDPASVNSTGQPTVLAATFGSGVGSGLHLEANQGPPDQFAYFLMGTSFTDPGIALSQGHLCVSGLVGRFNVIGSVRNSTGQFNGAGVFVSLAGTATSSGGTGYDVPTRMPISGSPQITTGSTWNFQLWHREAGGQANFSNGVSVTF